MKRHIHVGLISGVFAIFCLPVSAVIIAGGDGAGNTNGTNVAGWDYVGRISAANGALSSVTYIGNSWFITANHVKELDNPTGVVMNASAYSIASASWTRITNSTGTNADMMMFKVQGGDPGLSPVTIAASTPSRRDSLTMIGNGRNRALAGATWYVDTDPLIWIWATTNFTDADAIFDGYQYAAGATKRWGVNSCQTSLNQVIVVPVSIGYGETRCFYSDFDNTLGEAQGAVYDSGGGVFSGTSSAFELEGLILAIAGYSGQPSGAVFGNATYMANLSEYQAQITAVMQIDDLDDDGIPDDWEYEQSGSATGVFASTDQDGDGFTGAEEYVMDTDPTDSGSYIQIEAVIGATNQTFVFDGSPARQYQLLYITNSLTATNLTWITNGVPIWGEGASTDIIVTNLFNKQLFYQIGVTLP